MDNLNAAGLTLAVTTLTTIALKIIDKRVNDKKSQQDLHSELRKDLWEQVQEAEKRADVIQAECDKWRDRYYEQLALLSPLRGKLQRYIDRFGELEKSEPPPKVTT